MSKPVRCRHCGVLFIPEHPLVRIGPWRYCPRCRGPLPPTGSVVVAESFGVHAQVATGRVLP
jgi:hypothetical protein